jgi:transcriptional regulator with XRE-family HTH domain
MRTMSGNQATVETVDISERLRLLMTTRKMSVIELANSAGVSKSAMEKYLAGPSSPRATAIASLCLNLGVSSEWLLLGRADEDQYLVRSVATSVIIALLQDIKQPGPLREQFQGLEAGSSDWRHFCFVLGDERACDMMNQIATERQKRLQEGFHTSVGQAMPLR